MIKPGSNQFVFILRLGNGYQVVPLHLLSTSPPSVRGNWRIFERLPVNST